MDVQIPKYYYIFPTQNTITTLIYENILHKIILLVYSYFSLIHTDYYLLKSYYSYASNQVGIAHINMYLPYELALKLGVRQNPFARGIPKVKIVHERYF